MEWDGQCGTVSAMAIGNLVVYVFGVFWLTSFIGLEKALLNGVIPFLYGDLIKLIIAAGLMPVFVFDQYLGMI